MTSKHRRSTSIRVLLGLVLLLWSVPVTAQEDASSATARQATPSVADSSSAGSAPPAQGSSDFHIALGTENDSGVESASEFISFVLLIGFLIVIASVFAGGFAAVSIFMDSGCLRWFVAALGWGIAVLAGLIVGVLCGAAFGGAQAFLMVGLFGGGILYIAAWQRGQQRADELSEIDRLTWKRTLTGGALIGTGAGSVANLARSAGALFKGGGGSFGGGGASGSFGSAQAAAASATGAAVKSAAAPGVVVLGATGTSDSPSDDASGQSASPSVPHRRSWMDAAAEQWDRLRWYHGVVFVLVGLIFLPVGMGAAAILQNGRWLLGFTLVGLSVWVYVRTVINQYSDFFTAGVIILVPLTMASVWLAHHSQAPYWHLGIVLTVVLAVALYRSNFRSAPTPDETDEAAAFDGGGASSRW